MQIGVVGSKEVVSEDIWAAALNVGREIARSRGVLVCGGLTGIMEAAAKGAKEAGGETLGIIPGTEKNDANPYIDIVVATGIGYARNTIIAATSDALILVAGGLGSMSEVAFALNLGKPVVAIENTGGVAELLADKEIDGRKILLAASAKEAVKLVCEKIRKREQ